MSADMPVPLSEAWWEAIARAAERVRPDEVAPVALWLDRIEAAFDDEADHTARCLARQVPAPVLRALGEQN